MQTLKEIQNAPAFAYKHVPKHAMLKVLASKKRDKSKTWSGGIISWGRKAY